MIVEAIRGRRDLVVVAQSFGGYVAPIVCDQVPVSLLVFVAGMVPSPGESAKEMFANTGYAQEPQEDSSDRAIFYHDAPTGSLPRRSHGDAGSHPLRVRSHGRCPRGPTSACGISCVGTTACSRAGGCVESCETAWESRPTTSTAVTAPPSVDRTS